MGCELRLVDGPVSAGEALRLRVHGDEESPTIVYIPGIHGDWTLVGGLRAALGNRVRFLDFTYPRTTDWSISEYAQAIESVLQTAGIKRGWILAESFGSQLAWPLCASSRSFQAEGLILAAGFGRYPLRPLVRGSRVVARHIPLRWIRGGLWFYRRYSRIRYRSAPETLADVPEFIARRTEQDRQAGIHRLDLIVANDPASLARQFKGPVYYLAGLFDPVVPWPFVPSWLRRHCSGFRGWRLIPGADHHVLAAAPTAARQILSWIASHPG